MKIEYPSSGLKAALKYLKPVGAVEHAYLSDGCVVVISGTAGYYRVMDEVQHPAFAIELTVLTKLLQGSESITFNISDDGEVVKAKGKATATLKQGKIPSQVAATLLLNPEGTPILFESLEAPKLLSTFCGSKSYVSIFCVGGYLIATDGVSASFLEVGESMTPGAFPGLLLSAYAEGDLLTLGETKAYLSNDRAVICMGFCKVPNHIQRLTDILRATQQSPQLGVFWSDELDVIVQPWSSIASEDTIKLTCEQDGVFSVQVQTKGAVIDEELTATAEVGTELEMNISALAKYVRHMPPDVFLTITSDENMPYRVEPSVSTLPRMLAPRKS